MSAPSHEGTATVLFGARRGLFSPLLLDAIDRVRLGSTLPPEGSPRTRLRENRVRCRLCAGGNRIRTIAPAEGTRRPRGFGSRSRRLFRWPESNGGDMSRLDPLAVSRGTDGSNPASSSVESANYQFRSRQAASAVSSMEDPLGDVQTECGNLHGGRLLQLVALNGPSLAHRCRQGSSTASDFNRWVKGNAAKRFRTKGW